MKKIFVTLQISILFFLIAGCISRIGLKEPISFDPSSGATIPIHIGVLFPHRLNNQSFKQRGMELMVGQAVQENIGNSLLSSFQSVSVSTNVAELPATIKWLARVRFGSGTDFYLPPTIFQEIKLTVVLDFEIIDKNTESVLWKTTARGKKSGNQPPNLGLLNISFVNAFYRDLTRDAVKMALDDLNFQIQLNREEILRL
jgi:hypothetical protein